MTVEMLRRRTLSHGAVWRVSLLLAAVFASQTLLAAMTREAVADPAQNTCESCHENPDFLVTNRKLYKYYQEWNGSVHDQEKVTCDNCHGGDATVSEKLASHGDGVGASDPSSGIYYKNVVDTCGSCHNDILEHFLESDHFEQVAKAEGEEQGPTCVTCHGAINSEVLNVTSVSDACARCHNEETGNHPETPDKAKTTLRRFLSIRRSHLSINHFSRYITSRAEPEDARAFFQELDPRLRHLTMTWHKFDLDEIDQETREVLTVLTEKRSEIRVRRRKSADMSSN